MARALLGRPAAPSHEELVDRVRRRLEQTHRDAHSSWRPELARVAEIAVTTTRSRIVVEATASLVGAWYDTLDAGTAYAVERDLRARLRGLGSGATCDALRSEHGRAMAAPIAEATRSTVAQALRTDVHVDGDRQRLDHGEVMGLGADGGRWAGQVGFMASVHEPSGSTREAVQALIDSCEAWSWWPLGDVTLVADRPRAIVRRDRGWTLTWADGWTIDLDEDRTDA